MKPTFTHLCPRFPVSFLRSKSSSSWSMSLCICYGLSRTVPISYLVAIVQFKDFLREPSSISKAKVRRRHHHHHHHESLKTMPMLTVFALINDAQLHVSVPLRHKAALIKPIQLDNETTAYHADHREQLDLSTPHPIPGPDAPLYHNLLALNQWPCSSCLPQFRPVFKEYIQRISEISTLFASLIAGSIGLPSDAFDRFLDANQQHKLKIVKYPEVDLSNSPNGDSGTSSQSHAIVSEDEAIARQGVGPHKDSMLPSCLLQCSPQPGFQAQNHAGNWVPVSPIPGTLVVAIGQGLEAITGGVCSSTTHGVLSPRKGSRSTLFVPLLPRRELRCQVRGDGDVPASVRRLKEAVDAQKSEGKRKQDVEFSFRKGMWSHLGEATLANRVKSHPDVGWRWVSL